MPKRLLGAVGLVAEAFAHQRAKSKSVSPQSPLPSQTITRPYDAGTGTGQPVLADLATDAEHTGSSEPEDIDQEQWELDEFAEAFADTQSKYPVPKGNLVGPASVKDLVDAFLEVHPIPPHLSIARLPCPVILPQRRPGTKSRGFVRAYAPALMDCGIDESTFLHFLNSFEESLKLSPIFTVIQVGTSIAGAVPSAIATAVSISLKVANKVATETYGRNRTNTFIAQMNLRFFMPHGLVCLIMTYRSNAGNSKARPGDLNQSISNATSSGLKTLRSSHGSTHGEVELPEAAPLIFPALGNASEAERQSWFQRTSDFRTDYLDRRANTEYAAQNPESSLRPVQAPQFESKWADPSTFGSVRSLRRGLRDHLPSRPRVQTRREQLYSLRERSTVHQRIEARKRGEGKGLIGGLTRALKEDILYMMIVSIPTQAELHALEPYDAQIEAIEMVAPTSTQEDGPAGA